MYKFIQRCLCITILFAPLAGLSQTGASNEGLSRQIIAMRAGLSSFSNHVKGQLDILNSEVSAMRICSNQAKFYAPNNSKRDANGCVEGGGSLISLDVGLNVADTGTDLKLDLGSNLLGVVTDVFQLELAEDATDVVIEAESAILGDGLLGLDLLGQATDAVEVLARIQIGKKWVPIANGARVQVLQHAEATVVDGKVHDGMWSGKIATPRGDRTGVILSLLDYLKRAPVKPKIYAQN